MHGIRVSVTGYTATNDRVCQVFYCLDERHFSEEVLLWEERNGIVEWSRDNR
jgi:hypothetical protein